MRLPFYSFNHSQLPKERASKKEGGCGEKWIKAHLLNPKASLHFFVLKHSLFDGVSKLYLFIHSFSFCVYCRVHSLV